MRRTQRGFTMLELIVALAVGAVTVVVAAQVARMLVQQAARGRQTTDFNSRARVLGKQLRADIRVAGMGSTGAITGDPNRAVLNLMMTVTTTFDYRAIPAVSGVNNLGPGAHGGITRMAGSDAIQLIVPNPVRAAVLEQTTPSFANTLITSGFGPAAFAGCQWIYIVDHSTPSGSGRTQIAAMQSAATPQIILDDVVQFDVQLGSDVMCARISTYWLADTDNDGVGDWLHRTDMMPNGNAVNIGNVTNPVFVDFNNVGGVDMIAPGIIDFQVAYSFSSELWNRYGVAPPSINAVTDRWAYDNNTPLAEGQIAGGFGEGWFETRMVRLNMLTKKMRALDQFANQTIPVPRAEDGPGTIVLPINLRPEWVVTTEAVTNLRYFDLGLPEGVEPEPM